jgi:hypothetical protein
MLQALKHISLSTGSPQGAFVVFRMVLAINCDYFPEIGVCNIDAACFL